MSRQLINDYFNEIDRLKKASGSINEGVISEAFKDLLKAWSRRKDLVFVAQFEFPSPQKNRIRPDGTIMHSLRVPLGYWEAKDESDDLDEEIKKKFRKGYPQDNIIFEDSRFAVLIQNCAEIMRCAMTDGDELLRLLYLFFGFERPEIAEFRKAVDQFRVDLPAVLKALRNEIDTAYQANALFKTALHKFLLHAKDTINPSLSESDVREMLIQHILTEEIFSQVFNESQFHHENNIAKELYSLEEVFFTGPIKRNALNALRPYYATIKSTAALIANHNEKQNFLKVIYENFYKIYDPKKADKLGVVYTPAEIVRFMVNGADYLVHKHFDKSLIDQGVEILDPATGTGTFICELIEHFRGQPAKLKRKYVDELHANEVAILPYYVANLNIEATYSAITGQYLEYPNLCFVDTLDLVEGLQITRGHQHDLLAGLSDENIERVKRQNRRKISVIIGNPPYNANQQSENDNNKNRTYAHIDERIAQTYIAQSNAQKTKLYDMYARFFRWAADRLGDEGVIAFVTNNSFVGKDIYDGFRKIAAEQFNEIYVIDCKGDARTSGERRRKEGANIFQNAIKVGVAISFFVKKPSTSRCVIKYLAVRDYANLEEKQTFIAGKHLQDMPFTIIQPDQQHNWIGHSENVWSAFPALASKETRATRQPSQERAIFKVYSLGVSTNRDEWLYSRDRDKGIEKAKFLTSIYSEALIKKVALADLPLTIKWSRNLKRRLSQKHNQLFDVSRFRRANYRPFATRWLYQSDLFVDELGRIETMFPLGAANRAIAFNDKGSRTDICILALDEPADLHFGAAIDAYQQVARYRYAADGERSDNITDWAFRLYQKTYGLNGMLDPSRADQEFTVSLKERLTRKTTKEKSPLNKDSIFYYVYAVLYDPVYREKYIINLRREFPRIPFYFDYWRWVKWGQELLALHVGFREVEPWPIVRSETPGFRAKTAGMAPQLLLKATRAKGTIEIDRETSLSGIPDSVWDYRLGNLSGIEWVLEQFRDRKPKDKTARQRFGGYESYEDKERLIDLLARITRVSARTMEISAEMRTAPR